MKLSKEQFRIKIIELNIKTWNAMVQSDFVLEKAKNEAKKNIEEAKKQLEEMKTEQTKPWPMVSSKDKRLDMREVQYHRFNDMGF